jgi:hypothetical protein
LSVEKRDTKNLIEGYADMGGRSAFDLKDGRHCEGYILAVEEDHLLFGHGGPLAPDEAERIPLADVDLARLSYWDEGKRRWMDARWDDALAQWVTTVAPPAPVPAPLRTARPWWRFW